MLRRSLTALTAAALVLAPSAAFAQESDPIETTEEEGAGLGFLADLVDALSSILFPDPADDAAETDEAAEDNTTEDGTTEDGAEEEDPLAEARDTIAELMSSILDGAQVATVIAKAEDGVDEEELENELDEGEDHGAIVSTVAKCAPNGQLAKTLLPGLRTHGQLVSTAGRGGTVTFTAPTVSGEGLDTTLSDETTEVSHTLTSLDAAEAFCTDIETLIAAKALSLGLPADATSKDIRRAVKDERKAEKAEAKAAAAAERAEAKAEKAEAKAERSEAKTQAKAERSEAKAARSQAKSEAKAERRDRSSKTDEGEQAS